ncbi:MAG: RNA polymerase factor sigma-54 [Pseudomonadota bacterium]
MALSTRLNLRQSQSLTVTPQLLQSIKLLQLTHLELERFIADQVEQNPLLENDRSDADDELDRVDRSSSTVSDSSGESALSELTANTEATGEALSDAYDASMENVFTEDGAPRQAEKSGLDAQFDSLPFGSSEASSAEIDDYIASKVTLRDEIYRQIGFFDFSHIQRLIAHEMIQAMDERGYLSADLLEIARELGADLDETEAVLETLQGCEPAGVFARDLRECLVLQVKRNNRFDPAMEALLANLELLAKRDFKTLRRLCHVSDGDLLDMLAEVKALDPHPGFQFETSGTLAIVPDVLVTENTDGSWRIELNAEALPRVLVNRDYHATLLKSVKNGPEKTFVTEAYANANWLTRSLEQRAETILKVATEIVKQQDGFMMEGITALKPMTMRQVADNISVHESTVSRVASNKYMMTPRGLFELRYFFTVALGATQIGADGSDSHSAEAVRAKIRKLINAETTKTVLSDDAIVSHLKKDGVDIARRTVAKYREGMGISSSVQRRREKKAFAVAAG